MSAALKELKKSILDVDKKIKMRRCGEKPMITSAKVAESPGWVKLGSCFQSRMEGSIGLKDAKQSYEPS